MPRIPTLAPEDMNEAQRSFHDNIVAGPRAGMAGPFHAWILSQGTVTLNAFEMALPEGVDPPFKD